MSILSTGTTLLSINKCNFEAPAKRCEHCGQRNLFNFGPRNVETSPYMVVTSSHCGYWVDLCSDCVTSLEESIAPTEKCGDACEDCHDDYN